MARRPRREIVLGAVAVLLMAVALFSRANWTSNTAGNAPGQPPAARSAPQAAQNAQKLATGVEDLRLDSLEEPRPEPVDAARNPFRFKPKPPPPPPAPPSQGTLAAPIGPSVPPPPPRIMLKFIGILKAQNARPIAVLSDARGVYHGRVGDLIEGRYRILNIGVESIELAYLDGRGRQTIRLTGQ